MIEHYRGPFSSERPDHTPLVECMWSSGLNFVAGATAGRYPVDSDEREAFRRVGGGSDSGPSTFAQLRHGLGVRYGMSGDMLAANASTVHGAVRLGWVVVVGHYNVLPAHFRRWQPAGRFVHACAAGPLDATRVWWVDPLKPVGYAGEPMLISTFLAFARDGDYSALGGFREFARAHRAFVHPGHFHDYTFDGHGWHRRTRFTRGFHAHVGNSDTPGWIDRRPLRKVETGFLTADGKAHYLDARDWWVTIIDGPRH